MSDGSRLDPRLLLAFAAIYEEGNVSRAAEKLGLTQQGVSGSLARLRDLFGDRLFVRQGHGVVPTPKAEDVYPKVLQAISALDHVLDSKVFDPASVKSTVRIAAVDYAMATVVLPLIRALAPVAPGLNFLVQNFRGELDSWDDRRGGVDLIFTVRDFLPQNMRAITLYSDRYVLAMRRDHPLAGRQLSLAQFCEAEHLLVSPNQAVAFGVTDAALSRLGHSRRIRLVVSGFALAPKILSETDLIAILPERLVADFQEILEMRQPPLDLDAFEVLAGWPDRFQEAPMHRWLRETLRIYVGDR